MRIERALTILAALTAALGVHTAKAEYGPTYYTREDSMRCRNQTSNALIGAGIGTGVGALGGAALVAGARGAGALVGAGIGALTGGILGLGLSCEEEVSYVEHVDQTIGDYRYPYWEPIVRDNYRIVMLERGKNRFGESCSFYQVEFFGADQRPYAVRETACRIGGVWRHFRYAEGDQPIIFHRHWSNRRAREQMRVAWAPLRSAYRPAGPADRLNYESERDLAREARSLDYRYDQLRAGQQTMQ